MTDATSPRIKITWLLGTVLALSIFAVIGWYSASKSLHFTDYNELRAEARVATLKELQDDARKTLTTADWVDQGKQIARIPIDEAMVKEIETLRDKPPVSGCEIPGSTPPPTPAPAPVPAAEPEAATSTTTAAPAASTSAAPAKPKK